MGNYSPFFSKRFGSVLEDSRGPSSQDEAMKLRFDLNFKIFHVYAHSYGLLSFAGTHKSRVLFDTNQSGDTTQYFFFAEIRL
jgi:hypothetical protein